jgi:hypothetical protein
MTTNTRIRRGSGLPWIMGVVAIAFGIYAVSGILAANYGNPTALIKFSPADPAAFSYAEGLLGDVVPSPGLGHDGKFYFTQAMDPFYLNPEQNAIYLDRPTYRAQRMLYPTIAGAFGLGSPTFVAWALIIVNVLALGVGTTITALLARELGISALFGVVFLFNPGVLVSTVIDTAEVLATLFFVLAVLLLMRNRMLGASVALTASVLSRETMILAVIGLIGYRLFRKQRLAWHLALPFVIPGAWWLYLRFRLGDLTDSVQDIRAVGVPFKGLLEAFSGWLSPPVAYIDMAMGIALMAIAVMLVWRTVRSPQLVGAMAVGFALIAILMVEPVWEKYWDSSRALAPMFTAYVLLVFSQPFGVDRKLDPGEAVLVGGHHVF